MVEKTDGADDGINPTDSTTFRALAARANYLSSDRPDMSYATKELCEHVSQPTSEAAQGWPRTVPARGLNSQPNAAEAAQGCAAVKLGAAPKDPNSDPRAPGPAADNASKGCRSAELASQSAQPEPAEEKG